MISRHSENIIRTENLYFLHKIRARLSEYDIYRCPICLDLARVMGYNIIVNTYKETVI